MQASQPCDICGCTEVYLHDGFYFCKECGTQDANFQETIVEVVEAGGEVLFGQRKKLHKVVEKQKEMSDAWYKWHAFNFLLKGVADELMEFGAEPSFKTKLMWVWTRYIKRYLKKSDIGLNENPHKHIGADEEEEEEPDSDQDIPPEDILTILDKTRDKLILSFSFSLLVTLLYIALNLDKSKITLTHLVKLIRDGLLSVPYRIHNIIPKEMKPEKLSFSINKGIAKFKCMKIRILAMTLFKRLDLGNPVVPDLRFILDNHLKELCLPKDLKPLVLSLMHFKPCGFLDVNSKDKVVWKMPAYEFHVMTYIIWALKLCLGLDCEYEVKLSRAAEAINENEERPQSFFINGESEPTNRLFSFREWLTFYQFRQIMLRHYCYRYANKCSWDTDDYIALEHHMDLLQSEWRKDLKDEMAYDLINRFSGGGVEGMVIPRSEFKPTLTPFHSYSQVIAQNLQDPELKLKLMEDFSQYSLKYAIEDWNIVNPNAKRKKNLVKGISAKNKVVTGKFKYFITQPQYSKKMVYVKNCENHNWLTTKPPTLKHLVKVDKIGSDNSQKPNTIENNAEEPTENADNKMKEPIEKTANELDSKTNSNISIANSSISSSLAFVDEAKVLDSDKLDAAEKAKIRKLNDSVASNIKFPDIVSENSFNSSLSSCIQFDDTKVLESSKLDDNEKEKLRQMQESVSNPYEIKEEAEGVNIFDDDFKQEIKEEVEQHCGMDNENTFDDFQNVPIANDQINENDNQSDISSIDSVVSFNEAKFDRANAVREIILYTCKKHKLPLPPEYTDKSKYRKKEMGFFSNSIQTLLKLNKPYTKRNITHEKLRRGVWQGYVTDYHSIMQDDALNQIEQSVNQAIQNANQQSENLEDTTQPIDGIIDNADNNIEVDNQIHDETMNNTINDERDSDVQSKHNSDEERLYSEDSDGETHAKELLPEKNPDFDEEVYDASQLYVRAAKPDNEGEMELDPSLSSIINKKIAKDEKDPSLLAWTEERKKLEREDSEDEMPLSVLQELNVLRAKLSKQDNEDLEPFLDREVNDFQYWLKFYYFSSHDVLCRVFEKEVSDGMSKSFTFLLRQCAHLLDVSEGELYRNLQRFETTAVEKLKIDLQEYKTGSRYNEAQY